LQTFRKRSRTSRRVADDEDVRRLAAAVAELARLTNDSLDLIGVEVVKLGALRDDS
jgi:hypothetical protein